jgi:N-terminal acetyltransferase B complex non-catalytic subunit
VDICVELYQDMWTKYPTSIEIGEQVFLNAAACWDTKTMAESSRKVFNGIKDAERARMAAWAEWANVRFVLILNSDGQDTDNTQRSPQPTSSTLFPPPAPEGTLKIASILLATAGPAVPSSDILWLRLQVLLSSGQNRKAHELLVEHGHGGGLARDWYRMKGVEEIAKREQERDQDVTWVWGQELGQFLQEWSKDNMA